jgi:membrane-bound lytic murein transglycosylase B
VTTISPTATSIPALQLDSITAQFVLQVQAEVGSAKQADAQAEAALTAAVAAQAAATGALVTATHRLNGLTDTQRREAANVVATRTKLRDFAVASYVTGGPGTAISALLSSESISDYTQRRAVFSAYANQSTDDLHAYQQARATAQKETLVSVDEVQHLTAAKAVADQAALAATERAATTSAALADREALLTLAQDAVPSQGTDIARLVLDAYQQAAAVAGRQRCQLAWWGLAGIGKVESDQGRAQHAQLSPAGELVPTILGPALDGSNGTEAIRATDGGKFTGDPVWDHAVGPLQFIPSTWKVWGRDGNGDGVTDPNNIYDAALGAATYLCATSKALLTDTGLQAAYQSYNHSDAYVAEVLAYAHAYHLADESGRVPKLSKTPLYTLAPTTTAPPPGATTTTEGPTTTEAGGTPVGPPGGVSPTPSSPTTTAPPG